MTSLPQSFVFTLKQLAENYGRFDVYIHLGVYLYLLVNFPAALLLTPAIVNPNG